MHYLVQTVIQDHFLTKGSGLDHRQDLTCRLIAGLPDKYRIRQQSKYNMKAERLNSSKQSSLFSMVPKPGRSQSESRMNVRSPPQNTLDQMLEEVDGITSKRSPKLIVVKPGSGGTDTDQQVTVPVQIIS